MRQVKLSVPDWVLTMVEQMAHEMRQRQNPLGLPMTDDELFSRALSIGLAEMMREHFANECRCSVTVQIASKK